MASRPLPVYRRRPKRAVSEVVGSSLLLAITVASFAVLFFLVQSSPKPSPGVSADLQATLERTSPSTVNLVISHVGGEDLHDSDTQILVTVNTTTSSYNVSQGLGGQQVFAVGAQWRLSLPGNVTPDTRVVVTVVSRLDNSVLYTAELQPGYASGTAGYPPIIVLAYAVSANGDARVLANGIETYRLNALVIDPDGNLDASTGVWADVTVVPSGPLFQTTALNAGRFNLTRTQGSHFQTSDLVMGLAVPPGNYSVGVHALDLAGGGANGSLPLGVDAFAAGNGPSLSVTGSSIAPISVNTSATDVPILRLNISSAGGDTSVSQLVVQKAGSLPDDEVTVSAWVDMEGDGVFSATDDIQVTPETGFVTGSANIFAVPISVVPSGTTRAIFVVATLVNAADGTNVSFSMVDNTTVRGTGVPGGVPASTTGNFPVVATDVVVGSKFSLELSSGAPDRMLVGSKNVRFLAFSVRAAGEPFNVKKLNLTLLGTMPRSSASAYVLINGSMISSAQNFDSTRTARFSVNFPVLDTAGWIPMEAYVNISGTSGQTLGLALNVPSDSFAVGQVSGKGRNGVSSAPFPISSGLVTLTTAGNLSVDEWNDTTLATDVRAGASSIYLHTFKIRAHGESVDFNKLELVQTGNLTDAQFLAVTLRVRGGVWLSGTFFAGKVTWDAGITGKLFGITINVTNAGEAVFDVYTNLTTGVQGKEFSMYLNDNTKARGYAKTSLTTVYANAENAPFPISLGVRRIQGDVTIWGSSLAPSAILAPASLVPVLHMTVKPVGENMTLDELFIRSLQGTPPSGSVTVHLFRDANNDTTTAVQGDDSEIAVTDAGPFGSDTLKAFAPAFLMTTGSDWNFFFAMDFTTGAAGFNVEDRVNVSNITVRGTYSLTTIAPNTQNGVANPPTLLYQTPPVPVYDRGTLAVVGTNLNGAGSVSDGVLTRMLRVTLSASVENISINSFKVHLLGNVTGATINVALWWDKNKDDNISGSDVQLASTGNFGSGDVTFSAGPLLTVNATQTENLIVRILVTTGGQESHTVGVEVSASTFIGATGATSGLGVTPSGTFPMASPAVTITS